MNSDKMAERKMKKSIKPGGKLSKSKSKYLETPESKNDMMTSPSASKKKHKIKKSKQSVSSEKQAKQSQSSESENQTTSVTLTSKKRKSSGDNHGGPVTKQMKLTNGESKDCSSTAKQPVTSVSATGLTRKQRRNRKKNNSKKNKYKHLALNNSSHPTVTSAKTSQTEKETSALVSAKSSITPKQKKKKSKQQPQALKTSIKCKVLTDSDLPESDGDDDEDVSDDASDCPENNMSDSESGYSDQPSKASDTEAKQLKNLEAKTETLTKKSKPVSALDKAREKLSSARFRFLNEQLYTSTGAEALQLFQEDPEAFQVYHQGFQQQASRWPLNPLDTITQQVDKMPRSTVVADFGCGDGQLAESLPHHKVHSFDLVSTKPSVIACDIAKVPLDDSSINVAVFCLSLMGTNLADYLCEANRVLQTGGTLKIAEVISRFYSVARFARNVEAMGFTLQKKVFLGKMFMLFTFKKVGQASRKRAPRIELKACHYKRR